MDILPNHSDVAPTPMRGERSMMTFHGEYQPFWTKLPEARKFANKSVTLPKFVPYAVAK